MGAAVGIYDTTLRDGCQAAGISLSLQDKLEVARRLDAFGIDWIEGGWPGSNPKDAELFAALLEQPLARARLSAFGSTRRAGVRADEDANLRGLLAAGTPTVAIVAKAWDFHVHRVLRTSLEENLAMVAESVAYLKAEGREVAVDAEHFFDGYRASPDYALEVLAAAADAGADWLVLCDTNGGSVPEQVADTVSRVAHSFEDCGIGIHAHDDGGLAVANSLAAVGAGATHVQGTINGYGERVGNANLTTIVPDLILKLGREVAAAAQLADLTDLSHFVDEVAGVTPNHRLPYVGDAAFAHKGGIHVHAVAQDPSTYEHVDPARVGNRRRILVSELSGRMNIVERARELGIELDPDGEVARGVAQKVKELEAEGFQFEDAEASFELLVHRADAVYRAPFDARAYAVESRKRGDERGSRSLAAAEVAVGGEVLRGEGVGNGPVDALEKAVRRALLPAYPQLSRVQLTDFRSQIARARGGGPGPVRVRITGSAPGAESWTTVGSSGDLLHAAWLALVDCLEYAIVTRAGLDPTSGDMLPEGAPALAEVAAALKPELDGADRAVLARVAEKRTLDVESADDRAFAAHATALGATLFYSFGNFCAVAAHPRWEAVRRVNLLKGRPENQVGSVTTTADRFATLFDWTALPDGLTRERVLALMHEFYTLGPMGFRGPAAPGIPGHLTSLDAEVRTTQLIHPGFRCPSNELIGAVIDRIDEEFLFITSANVSKGVTGKLEPAHYDLGGVQADFGAAEGIVLIGHRDEPAVRASYPLYLPMSTSILAFHKLGEEDGEPALVLERHGSLDIPEVRAAAARQGFRVVLADTARERLPSRDAALV